MGRMMGITDDDIDVTTAAFYDLEKVQKEKKSLFAFDHFEVLEQFYKNTVLANKTVKDYYELKPEDLEEESEETEKEDLTFKKSKKTTGSKKSKKPVSKERKRKLARDKKMFW